MTDPTSEIYRMRDGVRTRWASFENPTGAPGAGGRENQGAKGHPFDTLAPGASVALADAEGTGTVDRIWMTVDRRDPATLRALRLRAYWDGAETPAVDVPLGDFFGAGLGRLVPFESALFSSPEGRSFNTVVPMPFRTRARLTLTNESAASVIVYYDLNYRLVDRLPEEALYFHAVWNRERPTRLGEDFEVLPHVAGRGRYLGAQFGVRTDPRYRGTWWGEGEVKVYLDGDGAFPTLVGTGTEDYVGTGYSQGAFAHRYQGAPLSDRDDDRWTFYRLHLPDPVYFHSRCRVTIQQMGGAPRDEVAALVAAGVPLRAVTHDGGGRSHFRKLLEEETVPEVGALPEGWVNYLRQDDVSAVAYLYLDRPESGLPPLAPVGERTEAVD